MLFLFLFFSFIGNIKFSFFFNYEIYIIKKAQNDVVLVIKQQQLMEG